jgi:hypothetical protein
VAFFYGEPVQPGQDSTGGSPPHISWPAGYSPSLSYYMRKRHHLQRRAPVRTERSQLLWTLPGQNIKETLHLTYNFYQAPIFCRHLYFVDAYILLPPIFCWRIYFVNAYILLMHIFVAAYILSMHIFCCRLYFVVAYILSPPIFCWRIYFVAAYILLPLVFCWRTCFVNVYLLSAQIICHLPYLSLFCWSFVLWTYHDYY